MERDGAGNYLAIYNWLGSNAVVKRKLKYIDTDGAVGAPPGGIHLDVDQSELRFSLDPEGGIVVLDGSERARIGVPFGNAGQLTTITEIHLSNLRRSSRA